LGRIPYETIDGKEAVVKRGKLARSAGGKEAGQMRTVRVEERGQEARRGAVAGDQRVGQQRLEGHVAVTADRGPDRQSLVGLHLLDEPGQLGREPAEPRRTSA